MGEESRQMGYMEGRKPPEGGESSWGREISS
jgi:hypothetical protein